MALSPSSSASTASNANRSASSMSPSLSSSAPAPSCRKYGNVFAARVAGQWPQGPCPSKTPTSSQPPASRARQQLSWPKLPLSCSDLQPLEFSTAAPQSSKSPCSVLLFRPLGLEVNWRSEYASSAALKRTPSSGSFPNIIHEPSLPKASSRTMSVRPSPTRLRQACALNSACSLRISSRNSSLTATSSCRCPLDCTTELVSISEMHLFGTSTWRWVITKSLFVLLRTAIPA
mmetsp:Transcript_94051/g.280702  ORF Transcript_94051/g.280702 Transcript_94051/m.280702 type:complete len:232 (+) Transcript_94051:766-1461(+)